MEIFDVFSMNGIKNYPAAGENKKKLFLRLTDTLFQGFLPQGGGGVIFSMVAMPPKGEGEGAVKYPEPVAGEKI